MPKTKRNLEVLMTDKELENVIQALENVMKTDIVSSSEIFSNDFKNIINRLRDKTFRLAVVGEFSSGKSTFLNALIGKDILRHGALETTATITEIENNMAESAETVFDVYYENGAMENDLPVDQLTEYTATSSRTHSVAQEISRVVIKSKIIEADYPISFIDTPGLNGVADRHREKTVDQIRRAHACIYVLPVRGLGESDISFLKYIANYQNYILFIQNFIDELKELEGETPEEKINQQKSIIENQICGERPEFYYKILPVSSKEALIARDRSILKYDGIVLTDEGRADLFERSRFGDVIAEITGLMRSNDIQGMQRRSAILTAQRLLEVLYGVIYNQNNLEKEAWKNSPEARKKQGYEQILEKLKENGKENQKKLVNFIETGADEIRRVNAQRIKEFLQKTETTVEESLKRIDGIEKTEKYLKNDHLPQYLSEQIHKCKDNCNQAVVVDFENLLSGALLRVERYTGIETDETAFPELPFYTVSPAGEMPRFEQEQDECQKMEEELQKARIEQAIQENKIKEMNEQINQGWKEKKKWEEQQKNKAEEATRKMEALGTRPEADILTRSESRTVYHYGFLGDLWDLIFGADVVTEMVPYEDYTRQKEWDRKKEELQSEYRKENGKIEAMIRILDRKKEEYEEEIILRERDIESQKSWIQSQEQLLQSRRRLVEIQKEKAKEEYLRNLKKNITDSVANYLHEQAEESLLSDFEKVIRDNKISVEERVRKFYEISFRRREKSLEKLIKGSGADQDHQRTERLLKTIEKTREILEGYM